MDSATYQLYYSIVMARKANPEKISVEWPANFVGPKNRSKRSTALGEATKYTVLGDKKLYYNIRKETNTEPGN
jgi:hypothetical protein